MEIAYFIVSMLIALVGGLAFIFIALKAVKVTKEFDDLKSKVTNEFAGLENLVSRSQRKLDESEKVLGEFRRELLFVRALIKRTEDLGKKKGGSK